MWQLEVLAPTGVIPVVSKSRGRGRGNTGAIGRLHHVVEVPGDEGEHLVPRANPVSNASPKSFTEFIVGWDPEVAVVPCFFDVRQRRARTSMEVDCKDIERSLFANKM